MRPLISQPIPLNNYEIFQWIFQVSLDIAIAHIWGGKALSYFFLSTFMGASFHPMAGHFVAEHYEWVKGIETYSYYGPLNLVAFNVGYHNEHHDFPRIPGSRLPALKSLAPDFYDNIPSHSSWIAIMWRFITDPDITPFSRTVRKN